jgi:hypothetical protein
MGPGADILEELTHGRHMQQEQCTQKNSAAAAAATVGRFPQQRYSREGIGDVGSKA